MHVIEIIFFATEGDDCGFALETIGEGVGEGEFAGISGVALGVGSGVDDAAEGEGDVEDCPVGLQVGQGAPELFRLKLGEAMVVKFSVL